MTFTPNSLREPTADECNTNAVVYETETAIGYAIWYPSMGGYVGKAVATMDKYWTETAASRTGGCTDVYVWHNSEFPFGEDDGPPVCIHHCCPEQFIAFGTLLSELNSRGRHEE